MIYKSVVYALQVSQAPDSRLGGGVYSLSGGSSYLTQHPTAQWSWGGGILVSQVVLVISLSIPQLNEAGGGGVYSLSGGSSYLTQHPTAQWSWG